MHPVTMDAGFQGGCGGKTLRAHVLPVLSIIHEATAMHHSRELGVYWRDTPWTKNRCE